MNWIDGVFCVMGLALTACVVHAYIQVVKSDRAYARLIRHQFPEHRE